MSLPLLTFSESKFQAAICLNGELGELGQMFELAEIPVIAADGAANRMLERGIAPDYVVGDMDSITDSTRGQLEGISEFAFDPDQNTNDFEKAIRFAQSQLWQSVAILGMNGALTEHTLNNMSVLMKFASTMDICVVDGSRIGIPRASSFRFQPSIGEVLSLIPQPSATLTTTGLEWNLSQEELVLGGREGARNKATHGSVRIEIHGGAILFFCESKGWLAPIVQV